MDAKKVGLKVKKFAESLIRDNVTSVKGDTNVQMDENTQFVDWLGSALIMQGCMIMLEAGCPSEIVLSRAVGCIKSFRRNEAEEAIEKDSKSKQLIITGPER
jgi:hypothetical protein